MARRGARSSVGERRPPSTSSVNVLLHGWLKPQPVLPAPRPPSTGASPPAHPGAAPRTEAPWTEQISTPQPAPPVPLPSPCPLQVSPPGPGDRDPPVAASITRPGSGSRRAAGPCPPRSAGRTVSPVPAPVGGTNRVVPPPPATGGSPLLGDIPGVRAARCDTGAAVRVWRHAASHAHGHTRVQPTRTGVVPHSATCAVIHGHSQCLTRAVSHPQCDTWCDTWCHSHGVTPTWCQTPTVSHSVTPWFHTHTASHTHRGSHTR